MKFFKKARFDIVKWVIFLNLIVFCNVCAADKVSLTIGEFPNGQHEYFVTLLKESLEASGHQVEIKLEKELTQLRISEWVEDGKISLHWLLQSEQRDKKYIPIKVAITNGLIGHRLLLIPKGHQHIYNKIKTLDDFKRLGKVGGFGRNWFDIKVWEINDLKYEIADGDWRTIFRKVAAKNRGIDYFSRGVNEISSEQKQYPGLEIEKNLMFVYVRDFRFYLGPSGKKYKQILQNALELSQKNGIMDNLIDKYWGSDLEKLNFDNRIKLILKTP
jgi:hypothetical protein